jgi:hypothetical protein
MGFHTLVISRLILPVAALAALAAPALGAVSVVPPPSAAAGKAQPLVPGLTYTLMRRAGGQVLHVLTMRPTASPLLSLAPADLSGSLSTRASLSSGMATRLATGATAGINADFFDLATGTPSGVLSNNHLWTSPETSRSALTIASGGALSIGRLTLAGRYQRLDPAAPTPYPITTFRAVNRPLPSSSATGVVVYTSDLGRPTPTGGVQEALISLDGGAALPVNAPVQGTVVAVGSGGGSTMAPGQVVISGKGTSGNVVTRDLVPGSRVSLEAAIAGIPAGAWGAIGGGPMLVQGGIAITSPDEGFSSSQISSRTTRSAVCQTNNGRILMVVSEGPQQGRRGYTMAEQANLMVSLGCMEAMGFDAGGSSLMALGRDQIVPWSNERPIADALIVNYTGAQISIPSPQRVSPNGDGLAESATLDAQSPVAGHTVVTIARRGGGFSTTLLDRSGGPDNTQISINPKSLGMPEGPYVVTSTLTPADGSTPTTMNRNLTVDRTLGNLRTSLKLTGKGAGRRTALRARFTLTRQSKTTVKIVSSAGTTVATAVSNRKYSPGSRTVTWTGKALPKGTYTVVVLARNSYGTSGLQESRRLP